MLKHRGLLFKLQNYFNFYIAVFTLLVKVLDGKQNYISHKPLVRRPCAAVNQLFRQLLLDLAVER